MSPEFINRPVPFEHLKELAQASFGDLVKAVVDVQRRVMALGGELHSDEEALLLERGSEQRDLWGINVYPELPPEDRIEFDSMINIRPAQGNRSRGVDDSNTRDLILRIVGELVQE